MASSGFGTAANPVSQTCEWVCTQLEHVHIDDTGAQDRVQLACSGAFVAWSPCTRIGMVQAWRTHKPAGNLSQNLSCLGMANCCTVMQAAVSEAPAACPACLRVQPHITSTHVCICTVHAAQFASPNPCCFPDVSNSLVEDACCYLLPPFHLPVLVLQATQPQTICRTCQCYLAAQTTHHLPASCSHRTGSSQDQ